MSIKIIIAIFFMTSISHAEKLPPLNKVPKSIYLLKKARIDADVGEPIIFPNEQQMRMLYHDKYYRSDRLPLEDIKKYN